MNKTQLQKELEFDEGCKYEIYLDHLGYPTFGIGHLIRDNDQEHGQPLGTVVSKERVTECFLSDTNMVLKDCEILFSDFQILPDEVQLIIANMMFNLGRPRFSKFKKFIAAISTKDWQEAANQMVDSRWYNQVPNRAKRLEERMRAVS